MTIDPQTIVPFNRFTTADVDTIVTTHGIVDTTGETPVLVEPAEDYTTDRLPLALSLETDGEIAEGAYMTARGTLSAPESRTLSFTAVTLTVDARQCYAPSLDDYADVTSMNKAYEVVDEIISEFSDPIPRRFIIETAVERGIDREATADILTRMETAGNIYIPEVGRVGGM